MQETRRARLQAVILEEMSRVVPREVKDPRVPPLTFTRVEVTPDGSMATVYVMLLGALPTGDSEADVALAQKNQERMRNCLEGLKSAAGYLRRHLAGVLTIRHVPNLLFKEDRGLENTNRVHELLKRIEGEKKPS